MIEVTDALRIHGNELRFVASRSGGPGGQNVNKVSTRVTLRFDVAGSRSLSEGQRRRIHERLSTRIGKDGVLRVVSQRHRSQAANRRAATERLVELLREALKRTPPRKRTRIPRAARERRLAQRRHRSRIKRERARKHLPED